ncbi:transcription-repair coupling factor [Planctomycetota bacterium]
MRAIRDILDGMLDVPALLKRLDSEKELQLTHLSGSARSGILAGILEQCAQEERHPLIITPALNMAEDLLDDLETFGMEDAELFPAWDFDLDGNYILSRGRVSAKLSLLNKLQQGLYQPLIIPLNAWLQPLPEPGRTGKGELSLQTGKEFPLDKLISALADCRLERVPMVETWGEFAVRGGIVDVFPFGSDEPFRVEFFGNTIESIRTFRPATQESLDVVEECRISQASLDAVRTSLSSGQIAPFSAYLQAVDMVIMLDTPALRSRAAEMADTFKADGVPFYQFEETLAGLPAELTLHLPDLPFGQLPEIEVPAAFPIKDEFSFSSGPVARLAEMSRDNTMFVSCQNEAEETRLKKLLEKADPEAPGRVTIFTGRLSAGFTIPDLTTTVATTREVFNRYRTRRRIHKNFDAARYQPVSDFYSLQKGDFVVHIFNGVGNFTGLETLAKDGVREEFLTLKYARDVKLFVPVRNIHLLQKYIGGTRERPELDRLGSKRWDEKRKRAQIAIENIAEDLLQTQVLRLGNKGISYPADDDWQHEFEASFIYEDTPDQVTSLASIKQDMQSSVPMDRLLCGDVGFGKTEMAVRAAFKAAMSGRQTAILVPTTILAQQHYNTFRERLAEYPVEVDFLSRFKSKAMQKVSVAKLKEGQTDIIVGTHRLLSKDIGFKDLGLLIIDEEQRFGVAHKERLKRFRQTVDILTLTATPIPRTLHMALLGIKDISSLTTPPDERKPILTKVTSFGDKVIGQAIRHELNRNGQVFFVHNRVYNIDYFVNYLEELVPDARISKVHGQMPERQIEDEMNKFLERDTDVLVCTTIVESGIDLPNVNTLIINMAQNFGLADLHQLRGRVGRFTRQAYAYLLIPPDEPISDESAKRLKTIERYSELGAGFQIALQDLEIRGAGNILGAQQSGHIAAIGYDLYCRILENAIKGMRGEETEDPFARDAEVELGISAFIPQAYISDFKPKLEMYRKISNARSKQELVAVSTELRDRFGKAPIEAERLLALQAVKNMAHDHRISRLIKQGRRLQIDFKGEMPELSVEIPKSKVKAEDLLEFVLDYLAELPE